MNELVEKCRLTKEELINYHREKFAHMYKGNDQTWCCVREHGIEDTFDNHYNQLNREAQLAKAIPLISAQARKEAIDMLKNYGISITDEGILVPFSDEWDYLHDGPRRVLLRGNDKGEACKKFWQTLALKESKEAE